MRLGASVRRTDRGSLAQQARALERAGADILWVPELYGFDGPSLMGFLACATERVLIGSAILPFYSRTPALLAMTAAGVDALSGGRCVLGIGASGPQVIEGFHGVPFDGPVGRAEEIITICRQIWRREPLHHSGRHYQLPLPADRGLGLGKPLKLIDHPVRDRIPIFIAAIGPKNVESAARLADGWIPIFFWPERAQQVWGQALARGRSKRDPALGPLEVVAGAIVAVGTGLDHIREAARQQLALYIGGMGAAGKNFYNSLACRYGLDRAAHEIQRLYLAGRKQQAARAVPEELIDATTMIGPPGLVKERIAAYREAGVTILNLRVPGPEPERTISKLREWIP